MMRSTLALILLGLFLLPFAGLSQHPESPASSRTEFMLGGIQVNEADHNQWASTLKKIGMNTVEVTVYAKQGDWDSDNIWWEENEEWVISEIRAAKKQGLRIVLILRTALDHAFPRNKFLWHGMIMPKDDRTLNSWFDKYQKFVNKWSKIAHEEGVHVLSIGSEMNALSSTVQIEEMPPLYAYLNSKAAQDLHEKRVLKFQKQLEEKHLWVRGNDNYSTLERFIDDQIRIKQAWAKQVTFDGHPQRIERMNQRRRLVQSRWLKIIEQTRKEFKGQLTYAANFDNYFEVDFWHKLDFIGINAYFPLRDPDRVYNNGMSMKMALIEGWHKVFDEVDDFRGKYDLMDKPLFFTELGYIYRSNTTIEPWSGFGFSIVGSRYKEWLIVWKEQKPDQGERAMAVRALYDVVKQRGVNLAGILYWKLTTHDYHIPVEPFVLHIAPTATDELQNALVRFVKPD